jgi:hypothetical protein
MNRPASHERLYRFLLRLYPASFHERFADEMVQLFGDQLRDARAAGVPAGTARTWLRTLADLAATAASERARRDRTVAHSLAAPSALSRALGGFGIVGGLVLMAAFVIDIPPEVNVGRLVLFNLGAIAVGLAVHVRQASISPRLSFAATVPMVLANAAYLAMVILSIGRPVYPVPDPEFRTVFFYAGVSMWLFDAFFGLVAFRLRAVSRVAALALAVGSIVGGSGIGGLAGRLPWLSGFAELFARFSLWGIGLLGLAWILLGIDVATRRRTPAPSRREAGTSPKA